MPEADAPVPIGTVLFNAYEIVSELGGGAMGRVYCAKHLHFGELRAIKVVRRDAADEAALEERLVQEAKSLIRLSHDAIVRCYELLRDDSQLYLVMEYVEGPSLQRLLTRGALPDDEVLALSQRLAEGLAAVHRVGVTHRDVSPANIVLPDGSPERAKIVDFGLADGTVTDGRRGFAGNPVYASPEQYGLSGGRVGPPSDFYSLGLVLAESTIGEPLDRGGTFSERRAFRTALPHLPDYVTPELRRVILSFLEPDPAKRATSLADARSRTTATPRPAAAPQSAPGAAQGPAPAGNRRQTLVFCASAVLIGLLVGVLLWLWREAQVFGPPSSVPRTVSIAPAGRPDIGTP